MSTAINELLEGKIDFEGQRLVEKLVFWMLISSTVTSFIAGFILQSLRVTFGILGIAVIITTLVALPPWPMFRSHPVKWLPVKADTSEVTK